MSFSQSFSQLYTSKIHTNLELPIHDVLLDVDGVISLTPVSDLNTRTVTLNIFGTLYTCKAEALKELGRKIDLMFD